MYYLYTLTRLVLIPDWYSCPCTRPQRWSRHLKAKVKGEIPLYLPTCAMYMYMCHPHGVPYSRPASTAHVHVSLFSVYSHPALVECVGQLVLTVLKNHLSVATSCPGPVVTAVNSIHSELLTCSACYIRALICTLYCWGVASDVRGCVHGCVRGCVCSCVCVWGVCFLFLTVFRTSESGSISWRRRRRRRRRGRGECWIRE